MIRISYVRAYDGTAQESIVDAAWLIGKFMGRACDEMAALIGVLFDPMGRTIETVAFRSIDIGFVEEA